MSIDSSQGINSMDAFMKLVQVARVRNAGFKLPVSVARPGEVAEGSRSAARFKAAGNLRASAPAGGVGAFGASEKPKQVLGTKFDAYA